MKQSTSIFVCFVMCLFAARFSDENYGKDINLLIVAGVLFCLWNIVLAIENLRR